MKFKMLKLTFEKGGLVFRGFTFVNRRILRLETSWITDMIYIYDIRYIYIDMIYTCVYIYR